MGRTRQMYSSFSKTDEENGTLKRNHFCKKIVYWKHWDILLQITLGQFSSVWRFWELLMGEEPGRGGGGGGQEEGGRPNDPKTK